MKVIPFHTGHLELIEVQDAQAGECLPMDTARAELCKHKATAVHDGVVMAICMAAELSAHRAMIWALISKHARPHMREITQAGIDFVEALPYKRIEATVEASFEKGHKWMALTGFKRETPEPMKYFGDDGKDYVLYARIKE